MASTIQRLFLIRHTTSAANLDPTLYLTTPDHVIPLATPDSDARAVQAAEALRSYELPVGDTCSWSSTYLRCRQTESLVTAQLFGASGSTALRRRSSFLLREQEFGDWDGLTDEEIAQRHPAHWEKKRRMSDQLGRFYFRFPNGESRADVVQRVTIFLGKMHRSRYQHHLIFLHGVTQRAFRMAWFDRGPEWFEAEPNPSNASVLMISRDTSGRWQEEFIYQLSVKGASPPAPLPVSAERRQRRGREGRKRAPVPPLGAPLTPQGCVHRHPPSTSGPARGCPQTPQLEDGSGHPAHLRTCSGMSADMRAWCRARGEAAPAVLESPHLPSPEAGRGVGGEASRIRVR